MLHVHWGPASVFTEDQSQALEDRGQGLWGPGSGLTEDQSKSLLRTRVSPYWGPGSGLTEDESQSLLSTTARPYWGQHSSFSSIQMRLYWVLDWVKPDCSSIRPDSGPHQASWGPQSGLTPVLNKAWLRSTRYPLCRDSSLILLLTKTSLRAEFPSDCGPHSCLTVALTKSWLDSSLKTSSGPH